VIVGRVEYLQADQPQFLVVSISIMPRSAIVPPLTSDGSVAAPPER